MSKQFYIKQFSLAKVEFQCQKQFHFKQFSLAQVCILKVSTQFNCQKHFYFKLFNYSQTVLNQTIQFSISMQFSSIQPIDRTLSGATIPSQSGPGSNGNEGVLRNPQSPSITGTSPSDCFVSYPGPSFGRVF